MGEEEEDGNNFSISKSLMASPHFLVTRDHTVMEMFCTKKFGAEMMLIQSSHMGYPIQMKGTKGLVLYQVFGK